MGAKGAKEIKSKGKTHHGGTKTRRKHGEDQMQKPTAEAAESAEKNAEKY
jgi:hypothetical protein